MLFNQVQHCHALFMSDEDDLKSEVDVILKVSKDSRTIRLEFKSPDLPFTVDSFILELETYLHEITQAIDQRSRAGLDQH